MVFRDDRRRFNYLTTRDLDLHVDVKPVLEETFDFGPLGKYDSRRLVKLILSSTKFFFAMA